MRKRIVAIIQARLGSSRLPKKVLLKIEEKPMLEHVVDRVKSVRNIDDVVVATTTNEEDKEILKFLDEKGIKLYAGSEDDVLDRYYQAAKKFNADVIVRITADCPLIEPNLIECFVGHYLENQDKFDYIGFSHRFPDGLDTELFTFEALEKAWKEAKLKSEREHVTPYIWKNPQLFRLTNIESDADLSDKRWTVDEERDLMFVREIYKRLYREGETFHMEDILKLLEENPHLEDINKGIIRNEGYIQSLEKMKPINRKLDKSFEYWRRAEKIIPAGTQTLSKAPNQFVKGIAPIYLDRGYGSHVWDVDGNEYIDYPMALGPIILGHCYPRVVEAVKEQLKKGTVFTLMHPLEVELAELIIDVVPCAEMVRFAKNGADATSAAIKVARAYTNKDHIAYCGYHGCQDWYAITTERNKGIPKVFAKFMHEFKYNDIESLEKIFKENKDKIGAVIMEQPGIEPENKFLHKVVDLTHENEAVFILDEIVTGFRYALGGAQEYYGIKPDLACFGKGMANGMPISTVVGKREIMEEFNDVFFSMTYGGECLSLAASIATINEIREKNVIDYLWNKGLYWKKEFNKLAESIGVNARVGGAGPRTHFEFKDKDGEESLDMKSLFLQETVKRGVLFGGPIFMTYSHTDEDLEKTLEASEDALNILKKAVDEGDIDKYMEGEKMGVVFRPKPKANEN